MGLVCIIHRWTATASSARALVVKVVGRVKEAYSLVGILRQGTDFYTVQLLC